MEREILFRGKRLDNGQWVEGNVQVPNKETLHVFDKWFMWDEKNIQRQVDPETVGQFTGMTDKNGTRIFEGGIVKENYKTHEMIYSIVWDNDYFSLRAESEYTSYQLDELLLSHCEVIGNIHDNPELL